MAQPEPAGIREPVFMVDKHLKNFKRAKGKYPAVQIDYFQSNVEGELVNELQRLVFHMMHTLNAAAYTHTSVALGDVVCPSKRPCLKYISAMWLPRRLQSRSFIV
jgi:3-dehydroquinate dehydratase-2